MRPYHAVVCPGFSPAKDTSISGQARCGHSDRAPQAKPDHGDDGSGSAKSTYLKVEKGDPSVSMGVYAMALFVLGFGDAIGDIVDPRRDDVGLLLDVERLPKRVRPKKVPTAL
jgi:hypothetical protein